MNVARLTHPAALGEPQLLADCRVRRGRRSGPGGQHRNKVETAIVIEHLPSGVRAEATEKRSQEANRQVAIQRLRVNLALRVRQAHPAEQPLSDAWQKRLQAGAFRVSPNHEALGALLAEALDVLHEEGMHLAQAAERLQISSSQLTRFLKLEPRALEQVNQRRVELGLRALH